MMVVIFFHFTSILLYATPNVCKAATKLIAGLSNGNNLFTLEQV